MLWIARHGRRVEHRDGQRDGPDLKHLEDPEAEEGEELLAHLVEAVIFACFEDAERRNVVRRMAQVMRKKVVTSWWVWWWWLRERVVMARMMKLEPPARSNDGDEEELVADGNESGDGEVVVV
ncbi:hypothetical protein CFAM422_011238 [Trichoderma lentiforme]|uniref:Uncharacterized protein n=1 Tax=Trichoderma lentiforme TaxID=1567552 RepID=A0A9P5C7D9_9HYPO|nr:hypothetical protein CFAM422_011238 [Trichoderma lentiforme]